MVTVRMFSIAAVPIMLAFSLLWGVCAPCQQFVMVQPAAKKCCDNAGKCKSSHPNDLAQKPCQSPTAVLEQYVQVQPETGQPAVLDEVSFARTIAAAEVAFQQSYPPGYSPPALYTLHSTFLI
jgi:hypothetical protein